MDIHYREAYSPVLKQVIGSLEIRTQETDDLPLIQKGLAEIHDVEPDMVHVKGPRKEAVLYAAQENARKALPRGPSKRTCALTFLASSYLFFDKGNDLAHSVASAICLGLFCTGLVYAKLDEPRRRAKEQRSIQQNLYQLMCENQ